MTARSEPGTGFLAQVCLAWEQESSAAAALGVRVVRLRLGMVLGPEGGALAQMLFPFRMFLGGTLGQGTQWTSWIHVEDLLDLMLYALNKVELAGAVNATSPNPVTNTEFTHALGEALRRPAFLRIPESALKLLFGEGAEVALSSQRAVPEAALQAGFTFRHPQLRPALKNLLG